MKGIIRNHYHWIVVAVCCGFSGVAAGLAVNSMGVFYKPVSTELGVGVGDLTFYLTIMNIVSGLLSPLVVKVMRRVRIRPMVAAAGALGVACYIFMSMSGSVWQFYVIGAVLGVANAFAGLIVGNVVIENWFETKMGTATAIYMATAGLIGAVCNPVFAAIIDASGWRMAYIAAAIIHAALILPASLILRKTPGELGLKKYGADDITAAVAKKKFLIPEEERFCMKSRALIPLYAIAFMAAFASGMSQHLSSFATSIGRNAEFGAVLMSVGMVGNIITKLSAGVFSDGLGSIKSNIIIVTLSGLGCLGLVLAANTFDAIIICCAFVCGGFYASSGVSNVAMVKERFKSSEFAKIAAYMSIVRLMGSASSYSVIGFSYDIFGTYTPALISSAALGVLCIVMSVWLGRMKKK